MTSIINKFNLEKYLPDIFCLRYMLFKKNFTPSKELKSSNIKIALVYYCDKSLCKKTYKIFEKKANKQTFKNFAIFKKGDKIPPNFDFICFIKQGDSLPEHALNELAIEIENNSTKKVFYSDTEFINRFKGVSKYHLKPEFDKYMLYSFNYLSTGLLAIKNLPEYALSEASNISSKKLYQLLLNLSEEPQMFKRIAKVLYSKKTTDESTFPNMVENHLKKIGFEANVSSKKEYNSIEFTPTDSPKVSIIIPFKDKIDYLKTFLKSVEEKSTYKKYEILLVNNRSQEKETLDFLKKTKHQVLDADFDFNYSKVCNFGAHHARGKYLIFVNNDMEIIDPRWIENLVALAQRDDVGVVGTKLIFENEKIQHAGAMATDRKVYNLFANLHRDKKSFFNYTDILRETQALIGACHVVAKSKFDSVGGYDENYLIEYSDSDLCFKLLEKGYKSIYVPNARIYHYEGTSRRGKWKKEIANDRAIFMSKYSDLIQKFMCYNPNLSKYRRQFFKAKIK